LSRALLESDFGPVKHGQYTLLLIEIMFPLFDQNLQLNALFFLFSHIYLFIRFDLIFFPFLPYDFVK